MIRLGPFVSLGISDSSHNAWWNFKSILYRRRHPYWPTSDVGSNLLARGALASCGGMRLQVTSLATDVYVDAAYSSVYIFEYWRECELIR